MKVKEIRIWIFAIVIAALQIIQIAQAQGDYNYASPISPDLNAKILTLDDSIGVSTWEHTINKYHYGCPNLTYHNHEWCGFPNIGAYKRISGDTIAFRIEIDRQYYIIDSAAYNALNGWLDKVTEWVENR